MRSVIGGREEAALVDEAAPNGFAIFARGLALLLIFLPVLLSAPLAWLIRPFRTAIWFKLVKASLASAGTAFIKWGQWASVRPDMFPEALCGALAELHSQAPEHSFEHSRKEVEASFGTSLEEVFDGFEQKPVASGSIAQVHRATLEGRPVAVKVRHPHVVRRIVTDFTLMRMLADLSGFLLPGLNLKQSVEQFSGTMVAQTRLDIEGEHLERFCWNFGTRAWRDCAFPKVLRPKRVAPTRAVLVETFEPGELVSKYTVEKTLGLESGQQLPEDLAHFIVSRGEDTYLKMLLVDNLMHADLHPGNILLDTGKAARGASCCWTLAWSRASPPPRRAPSSGCCTPSARATAAAARAVLRFAETQEVCARSAPRRLPTTCTRSSSSGVEGTASSLATCCAACSTSCGSTAWRSTPTT